MRTKLVFVLILFFTLTSSAFSLIQQKSFQKTRGEARTGYQLVYVICFDDGCLLVCQVPGDIPCSWDEGFEGGCIGCIENKVVYNEAKSDAMFDYVDDKIDAGVSNGEYTNNFIDSDTDVKYFRKITWVYDGAAKEYKINLSLTITDQL